MSPRRASTTPAESGTGETVEVRSAAGALIRRVTRAEAESLIETGVGEKVTHSRRPYVIITARSDWRAEDSKTFGGRRELTHHINRRAFAFSGQKAEMSRR
jgi:hypothetical protein